MNGQTVPTYTREQLEAMHPDALRLRAMNLRDAMHLTVVPPPHFQARQGARTRDRSEASGCL